MDWSLVNDVLNIVTIMLFDTIVLSDPGVCVSSNMIGISMLGMSTLWKQHCGAGIVGMSANEAGVFQHVARLYPDPEYTVLLSILNVVRISFMRWNLCSLFLFGHAIGEYCG